MTARNLAEFDAAMSMCQMMEQNVMYADVEGNIRYLRTGRVPVRPSGFDFSKPVPGDTSKSQWQGIHRMQDLVQVLNPPCGYMQNCNAGPDMMALGLQLDLATYPRYIVNSSPGANNSRGRRAVELLQSHPKLTIDEAMAIVFDSHADGCQPWQDAFAQAAKNVDLATARRGVDPAILRKAVETLLAWDGMMDKDNTGATLYRGWRTSPVSTVCVPIVLPRIAGFAG